MTEPIRLKFVEVPVLTATYLGKERATVRTVKLTEILSGGKVYAVSLLGDFGDYEFALSDDDANALIVALAAVRLEGPKRNA